MGTPIPQPKEPNFDTAMSEFVKRAFALVGKVFVISGFLIAVVGLVILVAEVIWWLEYGVWFPMTIGIGWQGFFGSAFPISDTLVALNIMLAWISEAPLWGGVLLIGVILLLLGTEISSSVSKKQT